MAKIIRRGPIYEEDLALSTGSGSATASRSTSTGGSQTLTKLGAGGPWYIGNLNNILFVDGVKYTTIAAADTALGSSAGEIWVNATTTTIPATTISANHTLRFIQGGTYSVTGKITVSGNNAAIVGPPHGMGIGGGSSDGQVMLKQANSTNLSAMIEVTGDRVTLADFVLDGNKANNSSGGVGIYVNAGNRPSLRYVTTQNHKTHGIHIASTSTNNEAGSGKMIGVMSINNGSDGVFSENTADWMATQSEFEDNGAYGLELSDSPTWRINQNDFGGNAEDGFYAYGSGSGLSSSGLIITANQFGNQTKRDIYIVGHNGATATSQSNLITGNIFYGSSNRADNTYSQIVLTDGGQNTIGPNFHLSSASPHSSKYPIEITETSSGRSVANNILMGKVNALFGTGTGVSDTTTNRATVIDGTTVEVLAGGAATNTLRLFDATSAASTPYKHLRVGSGKFEIINSAYNAAIVQVSDGGALFLPLGGISQYNGIATVGGGVPAEYAAVDLTAQTAAVGTTTLYAVPSSGAGQYRLTWNAKVTTAATTGAATSTLGALTIVYTDPDGVTQTITAAAQIAAGTIATTSTGNSTTTVLLGVPMLLNCKASTNITYAMGYASDSANQMAFNLHLKLESL